MQRLAVISLLSYAVVVMDWLSGRFIFYESQYPPSFAEAQSVSKSGWGEKAGQEQKEEVGAQNKKKTNNNNKNNAWCNFIKHNAGALNPQGRKENQMCINTETNHQPDWRC